MQGANQGNCVSPAIKSDALNPAVPPTGSEPQAPTISSDTGADDGLASIWAAVPIVAIVFATATLYHGRDVVMPVAMALILAVIFTPVSNLLERFVGRVCSAALVVILAIGMITTIGYFVTVELTEVADQVAGYSDNIGNKLAALEKTPPWLQHLKYALAEVQRRVQKGNPTPSTPRAVQLAPIPPTMLEEVQPILPMLDGVVKALLISVLVFFLLYSRKDLRDRFVRLVARARITVAPQAIETAAKTVGHYLLLFSLIKLARREHRRTRSLLSSMTKTRLRSFRRGCSAGGAVVASRLASGNVSVNAAPRLGPGLSPDSEPPCSSASFLLIDSPSPSPPLNRSMWCSCWTNGSNNLPAKAVSKPIPVSSIRRMAEPPSARSRTVTRPDAGVNLSALERTLSMTCRRRSPLTGHGALETSNSKSMSAALRRCSLSPTTVPRRSPKSMPSICMDVFPKAMRAASRRSSSMRAMTVDCRSSSSRRRLTLGSSNFIRPMASAAERIAAVGLRSSCARVAMNWSFCRSFSSS